MLDLRPFDKLIAEVEGDEEGGLGTMGIVSATVLRKEVTIREI